MCVAMAILCRTTGASLRHLRHALQLLALAWLWLTPRVGFCAPFEPGDSSWEGSLELTTMASQLVGPQRLVVTNTLRYADLTPQDALLIVHPERSLKVESLARFMREGGRVVLLDDYGTGDAVLRHFGMVRMAAPRPPARMLGQNPDLPIAEPASAHPTVVDVNSVALNHPTAIKHPDLSTVLEIKDRNGGRHPVAVAGAVQRGRLLVVSDASVFINEMMRLPGNREFAKGVIVYATDSDAWGKREGRLFILTGAFEEEGAYGTDPSPLAEVAEKLRHGIDALDEIRRDGLPKTGTYALALMLAAVILWWIAKHAWRSHRYRAPRYLQNGLGNMQNQARATFLENPSTPRALLLLEWRDALDCALKLSLDLRDLPRADLLFEVVRARVGDSAARELRTVFGTFARAETSILSKGTPLAFKDTEVVQTGARVRNLVKALQEHAKRTL
jgi:hypothetical protein